MVQSGQPMRIHDAPACQISTHRWVIDDWANFRSRYVTLCVWPQPLTSWLWTSVVNRMLGRRFQTLYKIWAKSHDPRLSVIDHLANFRRPILRFRALTSGCLSGVRGSNCVGDIRPSLMLADLFRLQKIYLHLETRAVQRWVLSKMEVKFRIFCPTCKT